MHRLMLVLLAAAALNTPAFATPPVLTADGCVYLVGAPPGSPAAASEEQFDGTEVIPICDDIVSTGTRGDGGNSVQLNLAPHGIGSGRHGCALRGWVGHEFEIAAGGHPRQGRVSLTGALLGTTFGAAADDMLRLDVEMLLLELDPATGIPEVITRSGPVFEFVSGSIELEVDRPFARALEFTARPGQRYRVMLVVQYNKSGRGHGLDFGPPGTGRGFWYDSIEVCLDPAEPPWAADARTAADAAADRIEDAIAEARAAQELADLETRLYNKECLPRVWMPSAHEGRLEMARSLVADRIAQAVATADPNVNARVAAAKLAAADEDISAGQYQRACRNLSDSLRALTTP